MGENQKNQTPQIGVTSKKGSGVITPHDLQPQDGKILLKIKINPNAAEKFKDADIQIGLTIQETLNEDTRIKKLHLNEDYLEELKFQNKSREDSSGNKHHDNGVVVANLSGSLFKVLEMIHKVFGFNVSYVNIFQKENDRMWTLAITMDERPAIQLSPTLNELLRQQLLKGYRDIYIWANPNNLSTINCGNVIEADDFISIQDVPDGTLFSAIPFV